MKGMSISASKCKLSIPEYSRTSMEYTPYSQDHEIISYRSGSLSSKMKEVREVSTQTVIDDGTCLCFKAPKTQEFIEHSTFYKNMPLSPNSNSKNGSNPNFTPKDLFFEILRKKANNSIRTKSELSYLSNPLYENKITNVKDNKRQSFDIHYYRKPEWLVTPGVDHSIPKSKSLDVQMPKSTWF